MTNYRQAFAEDVEYLTERRNALLEMIEAETCEPIRNGLVFLLRMINADISRNQKGIDSIDGKISELEFMRWYQDEWHFLI